ncbi:MAG: P-loop NTPase [Candidatus Krumholzibacteria bacterium]|nr:P-loop NTPase [Candidatus Krumholzibacteria bacterium]
MTIEDQKVNERMETIKHKVLVLSGKGGVGKSTIAVNLAVALAVAGKKVGLLDIDIHGPSVPKLLGVEGLPLDGTEKSIHPFAVGENLHVMSIGFLLRSADDAVIWRGPMKFNVIKQFLSDVEWGDLDYLIVDSPPGTGDEPLSVAQLVKDADGAIIVTTPQDMSIIDSRKCITFCRQLSLPVIGVVENMSGFVCPKCGERTDIFKSGGGEKMARDMGVPFLGRVPVDPGVVSASDEGKPYVVNFPDTEAGRTFASIAAPVLRLGEKQKEKAAAVQDEPKGDSKMRIAIPVVEGKLSMHFGHCEKFALIDVDLQKKEIIGSEFADSPMHEPGKLPVWLKEKRVQLVIAGGMGSRAQALFKDKGIDCVIGAPLEEPEAAVRLYLQDKLATGENICDH